MFFNSLQFIVFLLCIIILYRILPLKFRWVLLLAGSYYFYIAFKPEYIILLILSTVVDCYADIMIDKITANSKRTLFLLLSLFVNFVLLFIFKYFIFPNQQFETIYDANSANSYSFLGLNLLLLMGTSFYTFQTLSYSIEVYKGTRKAKSQFGYYSLFVIYFPQLVAVAIEKSNRFLPQLSKKYQRYKIKIINNCYLQQLSSFFDNIHSIFGYYGENQAVQSISFQF